MRTRWLFVLILAAFACAGHAQTAPALPAGGPHIQFATNFFNFGRIAANGQFTHEFVFTNTGDQTLEISKVEARPSCSCTIPGNWTHTVEPGKTGVIPFQYNSPALSTTVEKQLVITSNDKSQPEAVVGFKADIWTPLEVTPRIALLATSLDSTNRVVQDIKIVSHEDEPLTLSQPVNTNQWFTAELKTISPGVEYRLSVSLAPSAPPGRPSGFINLNTSSKYVPVASVQVIADIKPIFLVSPPQLELPPGSNGPVVPLTATIVNNMRIPLKLSRPSINVPEANVLLKEMEPGRKYIMSAVFPQGFQLPRDKTVEITIKTGHPDYPEILVPVYQLGAIAPVPPNPAPSPALPLGSKPAPAGRRP